MSQNLNYSPEAQAIEQQIARYGIALGIDWTDKNAVRALAREALDHITEVMKVSHTNGDRTALMKAELFGLAGLMLKTMKESAENNFETHGGPVWKAFGSALWLESESRRK